MRAQAKTQPKPCDHVILRGLRISKSTPALMGQNDTSNDN